MGGPGDPTGKRIDVNKTFDDAQSADAKPGYCGIEIGVEPTKGDGRWKVLVKATPDGGDVACQIPRGDYSCDVVGKDTTGSRVGGARRSHQELARYGGVRQRVEVAFGK